ncbi:hypothetical protein JW979_12990 [bacterium]|nr:hypothetical protein [candidate division CSSED10-310 bacterium]
MGIFLTMLAPVYLSGLIPPSQYGYGVFSGDAQLNLWALSWQWNSIPENLMHLWDGNAFYPSPGTILGSDHLFTLALTGLPFFWLTGNIFYTYYFLVFFGFAVGAWGMYQLVYYLLNSRKSALISAIIFTIALPRTIHAMNHIQIISFQWFPWTLLCLFKYFDTGKRRYAAGLGCFSILQMLTSWYLAVFHSLGLGLAIIVEIFRTRNYARFIGIALTLIIVAVFVCPFARFYSEHTPDPASVIISGSATWCDYITPPGNTFWSNFIPAGIWSEKTLFLGFVTLLLALTGLLDITSWRSRKTRRLIIHGLIIGVAAAYFSFGPFCHSSEAPRLFTEYFQKLFPFLSLIRAPARFAQLLVVSLALLAGNGIRVIHQALPTRSRLATVIPTILALFILIEHLPLMRLDPVKMPYLPVYSWLEKMPAGTAVAELPTYYGTELWGFDSEYMLFASFHGHSILNGYSRFVPCAFSERMAWLASFPDSESIQKLSQIGISYVIIHPQRYFYEEMTKLFDSFHDQQDPSIALNRIIRLYNDNYALIDGEKGFAIINKAKQSDDLVFIGKFGLEYVFALNPDTKRSRRIIQNIDSRR